METIRAAPPTSHVPIADALDATTAIDRVRTRWLVLAFVVTFAALAWLAGGDHAIGHLLAGPYACGGG